MGNGLSKTVQELKSAAVNDLENFISAYSHDSIYHSIPMPSLDKAYEEIKSENPEIELVSIDGLKTKIKDNIKYYIKKLVNAMDDLNKVSEKDTDDVKKIIHDTKEQIMDIGVDVIEHYFNEQYGGFNKQNGGYDSYDQYEEKYLKYKTKYLKLRSEIPNDIRP